VSLGCAAPTEGAPPFSEEAVVRATPSAKAAKLAAMLNDGANVQMPPRGVSNAANILAVKAEVAPLTRSLLEELRARAQGPLPTLGSVTLADNFGLDEYGPDLAGALADDSDKSVGADDKYVTVQLGLERPEIKSYLLDSLVAPAARPELAKLLDHMQARYAHFAFWDQGSEINAQEIILIQPLAYSAHVIVIHIGYAHA
jgi:hypothetical protein